ncbi:MAG: hypothetical protein HOW73_16285 [Polyangiaceae bacterium]|nr:hypothetical protein [Polyangiaceae bacterium]
MSCKALAAILAASWSLCAVGCSSPNEGAGASASATSTTPATAATTAAPPATATQSASAKPPSKPLAANAIEIPSTNLALEPPEHVSGSARLVNAIPVVDFKGFEVSLTISPAHGDMAHTKQHRATDEGFQKWIEETDDTAIGELKVGNAKEYYGFQITKLGDKLVECGTLTMKRRTFPNEKSVRAALALCKSLREK